MNDNNAKSSAVELRQDSQKELLIQQLRKTPIVQVACEKVGIGRTTYYRWHKEDKEFADSVDAAVAEGSGLVNDLAESQLMTAIKQGNLGAVTFWLKHHHKAYATKVEVSASLKQPVEALTPEQQALVEQALKLAYGVPELEEQAHLSEAVPDTEHFADEPNIINDSEDDHAPGEPNIRNI